jgi:integrase
MASKMRARASETREPTATLQPKRPADVKAAVIEFTWWMKKQGFSETTILGRSQILKRLVKLGADLFNPESVSNIIAQQNHWSPGRKANVVYAYALFAKWAGLEWQPPKIAVPEKLPFIPLERELLDLIAGCTRHVAVALQIAMETGARVGEIFRLKWSDVDFESQTIRITPEKGGKARIFKMSSKLCQMLNTLPKTGQRILNRYKNVNSLRRTFEKQRRRIAFKLGNPRLLQISFHTFRHWKATIEYYRTKDILYTMQVLGHKNIKNTLIYTHLVKNMENREDEYVSKVAKTVDEARALVEAGFEYVCDVEGYKLFRKRK